VLTRRAFAAAAAAACLAGATVLTPAAQAAPAVPAAATASARPGAHGGSRISPVAWSQLIKDLRGAWQITHGDGVTVAFVGAGIDPATPGLHGKVTTGPRFGHGHLGSMLEDSLIAASVAGQGPSGNAFGTVGMAPNARVLSIRVPWGAPDGVWQSDEAQAIRYAVKHHASVIYLDSLGTGDQPVLDSAVQSAQARGAVLVAASYRWRGLSRGTAMFPSSLPGVLTATPKMLPSQPGSCPGGYPLPARGSFLVVAPSGGIAVSSASGSQYELCGPTADVWLTSTAVLIKSMYPRLAPSLVAQAIARSARDEPRGFSPAIGFGVINPAGALHAAALLQQVPVAARPGPGSADPAARLGGGPALGPVRALRHPPLRLGADGGAVAAGVVLLAAAAVLARRRRQARVRIS
jgi:membrane-anchored mycosin MYCP